MTPERVSQREFARLDGCSEKLVRLAVRDGRLTRDAAGKLDASLAGTAWRVGNVGRAPAADPLRTVPTVGADETPVQAAKRIAEAAGQVPAYADSLAKKEHYLALLRQLEYMQRSGAVVELAVAQSVLFDEARAVRDAWLNWPAKFGAFVAADLGLPADRVTEVLTTYVHKQVTSLGEPAGDFDPEGAR